LEGGGLNTPIEIFSDAKNSFLEIVTKQFFSRRNVLFFSKNFSTARKKTLAARKKKFSRIIKKIFLALVVISLEILNF